VIEQRHERARLLDLAERIEPQTQAVRALNDAMALVCEQLLGAQDPVSPLPESHRAEPPEQGQ
jgi:hypothetical protein